MVSTALASTINPPRPSLMRSEASFVKIWCNPYSRAAPTAYGNQADMHLMVGASESCSTEDARPGLGFLARILTVSSGTLQVRSTSSRGTTDRLRQTHILLEVTCMVRCRLAAVLAMLLLTASFAAAQNATVSG